MKRQIVGIALRSSLWFVIGVGVALLANCKGAQDETPTQD